MVWAYVQIAVLVAVIALTIYIVVSDLKPKKDDTKTILQTRSK